MGRAVAVACLAALMVAGIAAAWVFRDVAAVGVRAVQEILAGADRRPFEPKTVELDGAVYQRREGVECYLALGIDVLEDGLGALDAYYGGGQSDFIALLVVDDDARTWRLVHLNRDSIVQVPVLNFAGRLVGYETQQLALAYAYGRGDEASCRNAEEAVSTMLMGQPIDGCVSLRMDGLAAMNDALGGVEVVVASDFADIDPNLHAGVAQTLTGEQALEYVRTRWDVGDGSNLARMERQRQYLDAFLHRVAGSGVAGLLRLYQAAGDYMYTDVGPGGALRLAEKVSRYERLPVAELEGEVAQGPVYVEYHLDHAALQDLTLELFYKQVDIPGISS